MSTVVSSEYFLSYYPRARELMGDLCKRMGYTFKNIELLIEALTHRSAITEITHLITDPQIHDLISQQPWNERLEFLGDSVLSLSMTTWLWYKGGLATEGDLSKARSALVQEAVLVLVAEQMDLGPCVIMGAATERAGGRRQDGILGDAVEALIGAIYLDGGFEVCYYFIEEFFGPFIKQHLQQKAFKDYKTLLQEHVQRQYGCPPHYTVVGSLGPDHDKHYIVECRVNGQLLARGEGKTKKKASQMAARQAIKDLCI